MSVNDQLSSKIIDTIRYPLMVLVVMIHTNMYQENIFVGDYPFFDLFFNILVQEFARIAVPLFFVISGYLFFLNYSASFQCYKNKIQ